MKKLKKKFKIYDPKIKEECAVFGISNSNDASTLTALGLHALQHRGQEGCGIVSFDGKNYHSEKRQGLVGDHFTKSNVINKLPGKFAIGHNRYSTTGETSLRNIQPFFADLHLGGLSIAHNGNLTNALILREQLVKEGAIFRTTSDTERIVQLIAKSKRDKMIDKLIDALFQIHGGYSLVIMTNKKMIGVRDPFGIRPLVIGKLNNSYILASDTSALDIVGAKFIREVENGEIVLIENNELGTAGSLKLYKGTNKEPILVLNGDVLTKVDFRKIIDFHNQNNLHATMAIREESFTIPFGVVSSNGINLEGFEEKPQGDGGMINGGFFILSPKTIELIEGDVRDLSALKDAAKGCDAIAHLAYINGTEFFYEKPDLVLEIALKGIINTIDAAIQNSVPQFWLMSSGEVYQSPKIVPTNEEVS